MVGEEKPGQERLLRPIWFLMTGQLLIQLLQLLLTQWTFTLPLRQQLRHSKCLSVCHNICILESEMQLYYYYIRNLLCFFKVKYQHGLRNHF